MSRIKSFRLFEARLVGTGRDKPCDCVNEFEDIAFTPSTQKGKAFLSEVAVVSQDVADTILGW